MVGSAGRVEVGGPDPEEGKDSERGQREEDGKYATRGSATSSIGDFGTAGVVAAATE
jgi:hypothetical protein